MTDSDGWYCRRFSFFPFLSPLDVGDAGGLSGWWTSSSSSVKSADRRRSTSGRSVDIGSPPIQLIIIIIIINSRDKEQSLNSKCDTFLALLLAPPRFSLSAADYHAYHCARLDLPLLVASAQSVVIFFRLCLC